MAEPTAYVLGSRTDGACHRPGLRPDGGPNRRPVQGSIRKGDAGLAQTQRHRNRFDAEPARGARARRDHAWRGPSALPQNRTGPADGTRVLAYSSPDQTELPLGWCWGVSPRQLRLRHPGRSIPRCGPLGGGGWGPALRRLLDRALRTGSDSRRILIINDADGRVLASSMRRSSGTRDPGLDSGNLSRSFRSHPHCEPPQHTRWPPGSRGRGPAPPRGPGDAVRRLVLQHFLDLSDGSPVLPRFDRDRDLLQWRCRPPSSADRRAGGRPELPPADRFGCWDDGRSSAAPVQARIPANVTRSSSIAPATAAALPVSSQSGLGIGRGPTVRHRDPTHADPLGRRTNW